MRTFTYFVISSFVWCGLAPAQTPEEVEKGFGYHSALSSFNLHHKVFFARESSEKDFILRMTDLKLIQAPYAAYGDTIAHVAFDGNVQRGVEGRTFWQGIQSTSDAKGSIYDMTPGRDHFDVIRFFYYVDKQGLHYSYNGVIPGVTAIDGSRDNLCALKADTILCWNLKAREPLNEDNATRIPLSFEATPYSDILISDHMVCLMKDDKMHCFSLSAKDYMVDLPTDITSATQIVREGHRFYYLTDAGIQTFKLKLPVWRSEPGPVYITDVKKLEGLDIAAKDIIHFSAKSYEGANIENSESRFDLCVLTTKQFKCPSFKKYQFFIPYRADERVWEQNGVVNRIVIQNWLRKLIAPKLYLEKKLFLEEASRLLDSAPSIAEYGAMASLLAPFMEAINVAALPPRTHETMRSFIAMYRWRLGLKLDDSFFSNDEGIKAYYQMMRISLTAASPLLSTDGRTEAAHMLKRMGWVVANELWTSAELENFHKELSAKEHLISDLSKSRGRPFLALFQQELTRNP